MSLNYLNFNLFIFYYREQKWSGRFASWNLSPITKSMPNVLPQVRIDCQIDLCNDFKLSVSITKWKDWALQYWRRWLLSMIMYWLWPLSVEHDKGQEINAFLNGDLHRNELWSFQGSRSPKSMLFSTGIFTERTCGASRALGARNRCFSQ